jgi:hypothetical protein
MKKVILISIFLFISLFLRAQKLEKSSFNTDFSFMPSFWQMSSVNRFLLDNEFQELKSWYMPSNLGFGLDNPNKRFSFSINFGSTITRNRNNNSTTARNAIGNIQFAYHLINKNHFRLQPSLGIAYRHTQIDARRGTISNNFSNIMNTSNDGLSLRHESFGLETMLNGLFWIGDDELENQKRLSYVGVGVGYFLPFSNTWRVYDVRLENAPSVNSGALFFKITLGTFIFKN